MSAHQHFYKQTNISTHCPLESVGNFTNKHYQHLKPIECVGIFICKTLPKFLGVFICLFVKCCSWHMYTLMTVSHLLDYSGCNHPVYNLRRLVIRWRQMGQLDTLDPHSLQVVCPQPNAISFTLVRQIGQTWFCSSTTGVERLLRSREGRGV